MGKRTRSKKSDTNVVGKGKVTPIQVAFIVDCYLANNNFSATRSLFRSEASSLLPKCEEFKGLLRLEEMLDEYVSLKEQKVMVDQTMSLLNQEKTRLQTLLQSKHNLLKDYNEPLLPPYFDFSPLLSSMLSNSPADLPASGTPLSTPQSIHDPAIFLTPVLNTNPPRKRKSCEAVSELSDSSKKACGLAFDNQSTYRGKITRQTQDHGSSTSSSIISHGSTLQGSTVAKNLFNSNSSHLQTSKKSISSHNNTSVETTPTNCSIISSKAVIANSPAKRDQVKGRLNFDTTELPVIAKDVCPDFCTTSDSDKDGDLFDLDFEPLSSDFSLSELLHEFGIGCEVIGHSYPEPTSASTDPLTGTLSQPNESNIHVSQNLIGHDLTTKDSDSITSVRSKEQCIPVSSPAKKTASSNHEIARSLLDSGST